MKAVLDNSNGFFTVNSDISFVGGEMTPLMVHCLSGMITVDSVSLLINRGADTAARDRCGRTCLHYCLGGVLRLPAMAVQAAWAYLIRHGADPFAVDDQMKSVTSYAYLDWGQNSSCTGDVWGAVLADLGVDVAKSRRRLGSLRTPQYTDRYSRDDFEKLWEGKEHLCPYYDVEVRWCPFDGYPGSVSDDSSDSDDDGGDML